MVLGVTHCSYSNTKISTESELFGASSYVSYNICYIIFMHHKGYLNKSNFFQDNQIYVRMEMNGGNYCTGNSRHIDIRYFS